MRNISFEPKAFQELVEISKENKKYYEKIIQMIFEIQREPFGGLFKPEPLKNNLQGYWSRRINLEHRLVYKVTNNEIIIISCKYHY